MYQNSFYYDKKWMIIIIFIQNVCHDNINSDSNGSKIIIFILKYITFYNSAKMFINSYLIAIWFRRRNPDVEPGEVLPQVQRVGGAGAGITCFHMVL